MAGKLNAPVDHLFRSGQISAKQHAKLSAVPKGGGEDTKMGAKFENKDGLRDQGDRKLKGHAAAGVGHINYAQDMGTPARGSGKPSKGGSVQNGKGGSPQPLIDEIDRGSNQKPLFPAGAKVKDSNKRTKLKNQPSRKNPKATGSLYSSGRHQDGW